MTRGQNLTAGPQRHALVCRSLKKDASSEFDSICSTQRDNNQNEMIDNFDTAMNELGAHVFSAKALKSSCDQKTHFMLNCSKSLDHGASCSEQHGFSEPES